MPQRARNVVIGGEAGHGLVTAGQILARSLVRCGYSVVVTQDYQSRIRGGHNTFSIRVSPTEVHAPQEEIDLLIALDHLSVAAHRAGLSSRGRIVAVTSTGTEDDCALVPPIEQLGGKRNGNFVVVGVAAFLLGVDVRQVTAAARESQQKRPSVAEQAEAAVRAAHDWAAGQPSAGEAARELRLDGASIAEQGSAANAPRLMLNGNQAIALGAASAGVRFCSFYPMTPSTSVPLTLIAIAEKLGLVVEQAEDEIAAINMAIGASYAGAPSLVATSGGGFALMVEGISLAGMTETPIVIVLAQRPGPATGLPTRTEQADLEFVLHAGHGEFPRAILAPGSVEECFDLTRRAFDLAERFQSPVFLLTDQFLADSFRAVSPFDVEALMDVRPWEIGARALRLSGDTPYRRHAFSGTGVTPRLLPGRSEHLVVTDSDEHTEDGHLTEDLIVRQRMVDKRLRKERGIRAEVLPPVWSGAEDPELLLVCWGSSAGAVREAARRLRSAGRRAAVLSFSQVWPLEPEQFLHRLTAARAVVAVEGNAAGQLARLIRRETGFEIPRRLLRYDGLPITPEYVLRSLGVTE